MIGLKLKDGDLVISNNEIEQVEGDELTVQTIQQVLSTNKGEWLFDAEEGINFDNILGKQRTKTGTAKDALYRQEIANARAENNKHIEALARRLDGE